MSSKNIKGNSGNNRSLTWQRVRYFLLLLFALYVVYRLVFILAEFNEVLPDSPVNP